MPPKKAAAAEKASGAAAKAPATTADGEVKFTWTPENERRLLLLAARSSVGRADYIEFVKAMPPGVSYEGLRQKFQKLRKEQKDIYESMGWTLNDSCPTTDGNSNVTTAGASKAAPKKTVATKGKKRSAGGDSDGDAENDDAPEKPAKKTKKAQKQTGGEDEDGDGAVAKTAKKPGKGRGRPKKVAKSEDVVEEDNHEGNLNSEVKDEDAEEV